MSCARDSQRTIGGQFPFGVDAAIKAADVTMPLWYGPPTETNYAGGLLTGSQSACKAATEAFRDAVVAIARSPHDFEV